MIKSAFNKAIPVYKPAGITPRQTVEQLARQLKTPALTKLGYAGRLDPMAEGVLLALMGESNKDQASLIGLDKKYRFSLVLGCSSDSYDLLGHPQLVAAGSKKPKREIEAALKQFIGDIDQPYPPYSAVRVQGHPLFWWARQGKLDQIAIPTTKRTIYDLRLVETTSIESEPLMESIEDRIWPIAGDFRQADILIAWHDILDEVEVKWQIITLEMHCSSGTYVRGLVNEIGKALGTGATTTSLIRTAVGDYTVDDCKILK